AAGGAAAGRAAAGGAAAGRAAAGGAAVDATGSRRTTATTPRGRPRAEPQLRQLADRRRRAEEAREGRIVPDEGAVRAPSDRREPVEERRALVGHAPDCLVVGVRGREQHGRRHL